MTDENDTTSSPSKEMGSPALTPSKEFEPVITARPQPLRRNSSAMLSRAATYPSAGKHLSRFWRRQWRLRRPRLVHPTMRATEKPTTLPGGGGDLPRRGQPVNCSLDDIMNELESNVRRGRPFPEFDSLDAYHVDSATAKGLRRDEAARLVEVITDPTQPVLLGDSGSLASLQGDDPGYLQLSRISKNISTALSLCLLDNECINVRSCPRIANRERLQNMVQQAHVAANVGTSDTQRSGCHPIDRLKATFALIDYISAVLARLVSQTASGPFWVTNVIAILAARVAKMKYLLVDLGDSASTAAERGEDTLEESQAAGGFSTTLEDEEEECEEALRIIDANTKEGLTSEDEAAVGSYCVNQNKYRSGINAAMKYILLSLRLMNRSGLPPTTYEMCVIVYEIGFEGFKTVLFQDRDLEYSASSDRGVLNTAHAALCMLDQILRKLDKLQKLDKRQTAQASGVGYDPEFQTCVEWAYQDRPAGAQSSLVGGIDYVELSGSKKELRLRHLEDIVTVMVPMIVTSPILLSNFTSFRTMMALTGGVQDVVTPFQEGQFGAFCRLYTSRFDVEATKREILRLSKAFDEQRFSRCKLLSKEGEDAWGDGTWNAQTEDTRCASKMVQERLDEYCVDMQDWVVDESSVTVSNRFYVASVMLAAAILGGGGLAIGFTVGERIKGVDPFNLATYTWVLAAFVVLICKNVRVEHWNWSDFLRWRVRCRSVSELVSASGVGEQLVMAKLLHDDCGGRSILLTRGPYNSVFRNQTDDVGNGFSIDRPISAMTLMLSGLALLKVVAPRGHAIVCLDHRRGTYLTVVEHQGRQEKSRLICDDLSRIPTDGGGSGSGVDGTRRARIGWHANEVKLKLTKMEDFKWKRVQGLYEFKDAEVFFE
ncbi:hypothetical protein SAMD00023353_4201030 [Rosellinia necatrix]|uniref:Uncharacterized protein n=1 Tax=Rosellinia necatrix TaxID=77044 RepID=A0A1W2TPC7_ROSNE|nr:hypothetical protein SAMD00023353_4201030 [Rosellinia necatrix]